ncbi:helix-turn-helix domain-containing protein [Arthrobacter sp. GCM10027362]
MPVAEMSPVESVDRALVLILLMRERGPVSVKTAAAHLGVAPSTAHRLLSALAFRGFASQDRERRYRLGPALAENTVESFSINRLRECARRPLLELHNLLGETVQLMVLRGGNIQFIDGIESESTLRVGTGFRLRDGDVHDRPRQGRGRRREHGAQQPAGPARR